MDSTHLALFWRLARPHFHQIGKFYKLNTLATGVAGDMWAETTLPTFLLPNPRTESLVCYWLVLSDFTFLTRISYTRNIFAKGYMWNFGLLGKHMLTQNSSKLFNLCLGWGRRVGMGCGKDYCEHTALWWSKMGTVSLPGKATPSGTF